MAKGERFKALLFDTEADKETTFTMALKNVALWCLVIALILTVVIPRSAEGWEFHDIQIGRLIQEAQTALLIGALLAFTLELSSRREQLKSFQSYLSRSETMIARGVSVLSRAAMLMRFPDDLDRSDAPPFTKEIARKIFSEYMIGMEVRGSGFTVRSANWALESNRVFYELLLEYNTRDLEIRVTHVGPPGEWLRDEAKPALDAQKKVADSKKATITRIFVGTLSKEEAIKDPEYIEVMNVMAEYNISIGYVHSDNPRSVSDMTWVPELGILMLWKVEGGVGIEAVEIGADREPKPNLERLWRDLIRYAGSIQRPQDQVDAVKLSTAPQRSVG